MAIYKDKSSAHQLRDDIQNLLCTYGHKLVEQVITEVGISSHSKLVEEKKIVSFQEAIDFYLTSGNYLSLSPTSKKTYMSEMNQFKRFMFSELRNSMTIENVSNPLVLAKYLKPYIGSNTYAKKSAFLRSFLGSVYRYFYSTDIDHLKKLLRVSHFKDSLPRAFSKVQLAELLTLAQSTSKNLRNCTIIWTFLGTGIRLDELRKLTIGDIDAENQSIFVSSKRRKSDKEKRKISKLSLVILLDYIKFTFAYLKNKLPNKEYQGLYIFSNDLGNTPIGNRTIQYIISDLISKLESIPLDDKKRFSVHSFRHSFAVYGLEAGIDIYTLSKLLGHESISSTEKYLKLFDHQLKEAIEKHPLGKIELLNLMRRMDNIEGNVN